MTARAAGAAATLLAHLATPAAASCDVDVRPVAFGTVIPERATDGVGAVFVACTTPTGFTVAVGAGQGSHDRRTMAGPDGARLAYNLYIDPGHNLVLGDGDGGTLALAGAADGVRREERTVYGRVPSGQRVPKGVYTDALTVTIRLD